MSYHFGISEGKTLDIALAELKKLSGASIKLLPIAKEHRPNLDAFLEVKFRQGSQKFYVEIKGEVREPILERIIHHFGPKKEEWLLVARYIPGPIKDYLKMHGYNYLEATGNCYISTDHIFLYNNSKEVKQVLKTPEGKLWKATGLKFLFVILQTPAMLTRPQRVIATAAGIASGNISGFLQELREGKYISENEQGIILLQREKLIDRWVEAFFITLRPKLQRGLFRFVRPDNQKGWRNLEIPGIYWAGEPGADLYTDFLVPEIFILYTSRSTTDLLINLKIISDNNGNIAVLDKFWNDWKPEATVTNAAPLLLIYADLKNSLDSRNWETAEKIKNILLNGN